MFISYIMKKSVKKKVAKVKRKAKKEFKMNIPNTLSILRVLLMFLLVYLIIIDYNYNVVGLIFIIAAATDFFDGFFARRLNQKTAIGARLDQVVDRIFMVPIVIALLFVFYHENILLFYLLILCLSREIIASPGVAIRMVWERDSYKVKYIGKITTFVQSIAVAVIIFRFDWAIYPAILTGIVGVISGIDYLRDSVV